jgi:phosphomannomutase
MVGCPVYLSPVGEANVIAEMRRRKAVIGGEGNGGVILPESHYGRDALVAAGLVLSSLAETGKSLSELAGALPAYVLIKKKSPLPAGFERKIGRVEKELKGTYRQVAVDRRDGIRIDIPDGWVQVRKSNTEPIYRLIVEARSKSLADSLVRMVQKALK